ncbi:carboxymuconolactone decarboxylase (plasmid) [Methylorubrum populi]|jgi:uncharacterized peroxidase-related enzyme|uniref:Carboxymuconolactone decarboxylase n=1 Tax=Methylorubrum populi TaxID=223967 RepID=A0A160PLR4_9HYPH|nr:MULTISPECIES: peroxidase-related enzyme [Methylobacteriaceae]QRE78307.1 peroxidase-related enzyme [Methylobacterium aquaticum]BAU94095.1 carboxymuconolactone decarboxylase [Methylorubrum populi]
MQRIASVDPVTATGNAKDLLDGVGKKLGVVPNLYKVLAQSPAGLEGVLAFSGALARGTLDAATRERIALAIANVNGCDYCNAAHTALAKRHKLEEAEIAANREGRSTDARADAAVTFARKVAVTRADVTEADVAALRAAGYTDAQTVEIVLHVAANVLTNYVNEVFKTEVDFPHAGSAKRIAD